MRKFQLSPPPHSQLEWHSRLALILLSLSFGVFTPLQCSSVIVDGWGEREARWHEMKFTFSLIVIESSRDALRFSRAETTTQLQTMEVWRLHIIFSLHFLLTLSLSPFAISAAVQWIFLLSHFHPPHHALLSFHHMAFSGRRVKETTVERLANLFTFFHPPLILFPMPFDGSSNSSNRFVFFHPLPSSAHHSRQWRCSKWEKQQQRDGHEFLLLRLLHVNWVLRVKCLSLSCLPTPRARHFRSHFHDFMIFSIIHLLCWLE